MEDQEGGGFLVDKPLASAQTGGTRPNNETMRGAEGVHMGMVRDTTPLPYTKVSASIGNGCSQCPSLSYSEDLVAAFGVYLCQSCKKNESFISKSTAKQRYLLADSDLQKLGTLKRANPRNKEWQSMKLFLESQVRSLAYEKYGGQEGMERQARERVRKKLQARIMAKKKMTQDESRQSKRLKEIRDAINNKEEVVPSVDADIETI